MIKETEKMYLVTFRSLTNDVLFEERVSMDERSVEKSSSILVLKAIEQIKARNLGIPTPRDSRWSFTEI